MCKEANEFTVATDYDQEGSVIGKNVVIFACKKKDANRMKFSTLTQEDLVESYEKKSKHLDWPQAEAGDAIHEVTENLHILPGSLLNEKINPYNLKEKINLYLISNTKGGSYV